MHFDERNEGEHLICAGAIETPEGGYRATVIVMRVRGVSQPVEIFRDEQLSGGHTWDEPERALQFAMKAACSILRERARLLPAAAVCA